MRDFAAWLTAELEALKATDRLRACPETGGPSRTQPLAGEGPLLSFCSNDYLGLAAHPQLIAAANAAATRDGFGAAASRLVAGDLTAHRGLEADLATFVGVPAVLAFPTGYQTNLGVLTALAGPDDLIVSDAANHASLIDGCRLSRAHVAIYPHGDDGAAEAALGAPGAYRHRLLVTESLFSMDGDVAPLAALAAAAVRHDAIFIVDEAHALGVLGPGGRGLCAAAAVTPDVLIGTLGKAFGAAGGFAAGSQALRAYLVNRARTFIYTTGLPPPVAAAASAAVALLAGPEGDRRRALLDDNRRHLIERLARTGLLRQPPTGPILPLVLGADARAIEVSAALRRRRIFLPAIRPPTVPAGTARLRITLSSEHTPAQIEALASALEETAS